MRVHCLHHFHPFLSWVSRTSIRLVKERLLAIISHKIGHTSSPVLKCMKHGPHVRFHGRPSSNLRIEDILLKGKSQDATYARKRVGIPALVLMGTDLLLLERFTAAFADKSDHDPK